MKIIFMGTPEYSVPTLKALIDSEHEVIGVYTKPDKPKGRGKKTEITPVKAVALENGLPLFQPGTFKEEEAVREFCAHQADLAVVIAYGLILPEALLTAYPLGCVNLHASLLPKFRGASPIQAAILAGESKTGVTSMQMDQGLDTGDMLLQAEMALNGTETAGELHDRLAQMSARLCLDTLEGLASGGIVPRAQAEADASYAGKITKEMGRIHWGNAAAEIDRQIRGMNPWPSAYTYWQGKLLKIWRAKPFPEAGGKAEAGLVISAGEAGIMIACGQGALLIEEVQLEGKKRMPAAAFLNGYEVAVGHCFDC